MHTECPDTGLGLIVCNHIPIPRRLLPYGNLLPEPCVIFKVLLHGIFDDR
jgi:hypothetical protein